MVRIALTILIGSLLLVTSGCGPGAYRWQSYSGSPDQSANKDSKNADSNAARVPAASVHIVKKGDTLYSIAWQYGLRYQQLAKWNSLTAPYAIFPGDKLRLRSSTTELASEHTIAESLGKSFNKTWLRDWQWPHRGAIVKNYGAQSHARSGVDVKTGINDKLHAVADGKVVYAGSLKNYGLVLIAEHANNLFSMLAHNKRLLAQVGERIKKGKVVALGNTAEDGEHRLHFEIRYKAAPLDVMKVMPIRK